MRSGKWERLLLLACMVFAFCVPILATDFIRGDANGDGSVSLADGHFLNSHLFRDGPAPECMAAADFNDDGCVDGSDAIRILDFISSQEGRPAPPFPAVGSDPTPEGPCVLADESGRKWVRDGNSCTSYGDSTPLEDPGAKVEVQKTIAGGGNDARAVISIAVSNSGDIAGVAGTIVDEAGIFSHMKPDARDVSGFVKPTVYQYALNDAITPGGQIRFGLLTLITDGLWIPAGEDRPTVEMVVCLAPGTRPGKYPLTLVTGELVDNASGQAIYPKLVSGTIEVLNEVADTVCEPSFLDLFIRGDCNGDHVIDISDAVDILGYLFLGRKQPACFDAADVNDDGELNISDLTAILTWLFLGGPNLPQPFPSIGSDPTYDSIGCLFIGK